MDITWLGDNSFKISDEIIDVVVNPAKNLESSLISDKTVIVCTESGNQYESKTSKVETPGEYEINDASIHGVANSVIKDDNKSISTCYRIESRGLSIAVIGMIGSPLDSEALSVLGSSYSVVFA